MPVLIARMPLAALRGSRREPLDLGATSVLRLRVRPTDTDWYGHMNNGRYLTNMDLGRTDFVARTPLLRIFREHGMQPVMAGATIRYRRPLDALRRYELHTKILGWDERWTFFEQRFLRPDGKLAALAYAKVAVRQDGETVPPPRLLALAGWDGEPPDLPAAIEQWQQLEAS